MPAAEMDAGAFLTLLSVYKIHEWDLRLGFGHCALVRTCLVWVHQGSVWTSCAGNMEAAVAGDPHQAAGVQYDSKCKEHGSDFVGKQLMLGSKQLNIAGVSTSKLMEPALPWTLEKTNDCMVKKKRKSDASCTTVRFLKRPFWETKIKIKLNLI